MSDNEPVQIDTTTNLLTIRGTNTFLNNISLDYGSNIGAESTPIPDNVLETKTRVLSAIPNIAVFTSGLTQLALDTALWEQETARLYKENYMLKQIQALEERVAKLEDAIPEERVVILRDIPEKQARQEIRDLFAVGETLYYSDIAERLGLSLHLVVKICEELQEAGEIGVDAGV